MLSELFVGTVGQLWQFYALRTSPENNAGAVLVGVTQAFDKFARRSPRYVQRVLRIFQFTEFPSHALR